MQLIFVFDQNRTLKYHGKIDDNWQKPDRVTKEYLREAITALLEGKPIENPENQAIGCTVKWINY